MLLVCWMPLPHQSQTVAKWATEWQSSTCEDCHSVVMLPQDQAALVAEMDRRFGRLPRLCIPCAIARQRSSKPGVRVAMFGPTKAVRQVYKGLGVTDAEYEAAADRGAAPNN